MGRTLLAGAVAMSVLGAGFTVPASANAPLTATTARTPAPDRSSGIILAPREGAQRRGHVVRLRVKARYGLERARLNGVRLRPEEFTRQPRGVYVLKATSSHGLRHGRNRLRVVVDKRLLGARHQTIRFFVRGKQPLPGAGRDKRVAAGNGTRLHARVRLHPSTPQGVKSRTTWRLVDQPRGARARLTGDTPRLVGTDVPGAYTVRSRTTVRKKAFTDTVTVTSVASPMQSFNAFERDPATTAPAVRLDDRYFPTYGPAANAAWQLLVFDRTHLELKSNATYGVCQGGGGCAYTAGGSAPGTIRQALGNLDGSDLVLLVHREQYGQPADESGFAATLALPKAARVSGGEVGAILAIPGTGGGVTNFVAETPGRAYFNGWMIQDSYGNFTLVDGTRAQFDTRSAHSCDATQCSVTVRVGEYTGTASIPRSRSAIVVWQFDRRSLAFRRTDTVYVDGTDADQVKGNLEGAKTFLQSVPASSLVVISSVAGPGVRPMPKPGPGITGQPYPSITYDPATDVANAVATFGGSRHAFLQYGVNPDQGYSLIGWRGLEPGEGHQVQDKQGRLTGVLTRDSGGWFTPMSVTEAQESPDVFTDLAMTAPGGAWPGAGNARYEAALTCMVRKVQMQNVDAYQPRESYWLDSQVIPTAAWATWSNAVGDLRPQDCPNSPADVFTTARDEFAQELHWNSLVRTYVDNMKKPFDADTAVKSLADLNHIAALLKAQSDYAKDQEVKIDWAAIVSMLIEVAAPFIAAGAGEAGEVAVHAIAAAVAGTTEFVGGLVEKTEDGQKVAEQDEFALKAAEVEQTIIDKLQQNSRAFDHMGDLITADYAKLRQAGDVMDCPSGPKCEDGFRQTNESLGNLEAASVKANERLVLSSLLPLAYPVTNVPWDGTSSSYGWPEGNWDPKYYTCLDAEPFAALPRKGRLFLRKSLGFDSPPFTDYLYWGGIPRTRAPQFETFVIAQVSGRNSVYTDRTILNRLFSPQADNPQPSVGGLGLDPADYLVEVQRQGEVKDYPLYCGGWDSGPQSKIPAPRNQNWPN